MERLSHCVPSLPSKCGLLRTGNRELLQAERSLVFDFDIFNRMEAIPERESARDDEADQNADAEEEAVSRKFDEQKGHHYYRDDKPGRSFQAESRRGGRFPFHGLILALQGHSRSASDHELGTVIHHCDDTSFRSRL